MLSFASLSAGAPLRSFIHHARRSGSQQLAGATSCHPPCSFANRDAGFVLDGGRLSDCAENVKWINAVSSFGQENSTVYLVLFSFFLVVAVNLIGFWAYGMCTHTGEP